MVSDYSVDETIVTWCAVTKNGKVIGEGDNDLEMRYFYTNIDRIVHKGTLPICKTQEEAEEVCRVWNKGRSVYSRDWAMPEKIMFKMMEVKDGE